MTNNAEEGGYDDDGNDGKRLACGMELEHSL